jgi:hypothetical protein
MNIAYDTDFYAWTQEQGALLRRLATGQRVNDIDLDWSNIADEIESVARSERAAVASRIATIIEHLTKLEASRAIAPRPGWVTTVGRARRDIARLFEASPTLHLQVEDMIAKEMPAARKIAAKSIAAHHETPCIDPEAVTYDPEQILGDWFPDQP